MILVNSQKAILRQFNRDEEESYFDDQNYKDVVIKVVPYKVEQAIRFGIYTIPEARGYYLVNRNVDIKEGDQIMFIGKFINKRSQDNKIHTVLKVEDEWTFNRVEYKMAIVK